MLRLYHSNTSVSSIKVRLVLEEKMLAWDSELLDLRRGDQHQPEYLKLNPNAVVPTLVHDSNAVIESSVIMQYLNDAFPEPLLMPSDVYRRALARLWMKKIDDYLHAACATLSFAVAFRKVLMQKTPQQLKAHFGNIPDPEARKRQRLAVKQGLQAAHVAPAIKQYDKFLGEMETTLEQTHYLAGEGYTLADAAVTPYVNRVVMLGMAESLVQRRPQLSAWLERMRARPTFDLAITNWLSDADRQRFDIAPEETAQKVRLVLNLG